MKTLSTKFYLLLSVIFLAHTAKAIDQEGFNNPEGTNPLLEEYLNQALKHQYSGKLKEETIASIVATQETIENPALSKEEKWRLNIMLTELLSKNGYSPLMEHFLDKNNYLIQFLPENFYYKNFRDYQLEGSNFMTASVRGFIATMLCNNSLSLIEETINSLLPTEETATALAFSVPLIVGFLVFLGSPTQDSNKLLKETFLKLHFDLSCPKETLSTDTQAVFDNNFENSDAMLTKLISYVGQKHLHAPSNQTLRAIYVCMQLILRKNNEY